jgi:hypothetical protein
MINLLLCATLLCPITIPPGTSTVEITARYYHEEPPGQVYTYEKSHLVLHSGSEFIVAEGHPWHVTAVIDGLQAANCSSGDAILISGFESGDLRDWQ